MERSLRKREASVSVTFSDGDYSNNLIGVGFRLEESESFMCLGVDLSGNLRVRDKESNQYEDAQILAEKISILRSVQIDEDQVVDRLVAACQRSPNSRWEIRLLLGEKGTFKYPVKLTRSSGSIFFDIC